MLISVHDPGLAKRFSNHIVGLRGGVKVLDDDTRAVDDGPTESIYHKPS